MAHIINKKIQQVFVELGYSEEDIKKKYWSQTRKNKDGTTNTIWLVKSHFLQEAGKKAGILFTDVDLLYSYPVECTVYNQLKKGIATGIRAAACRCIGAANTKIATAIRTGEASPANCKIEYPTNMAEKRAKDRCVIELLSIEGDVYSDTEEENITIGAKDRPEEVKSDFKGQRPLDKNKPQEN
jgi:hypothetical protein